MTFKLFIRDTSPVSELHCYEVAVQVMERGQNLITPPCVDDGEIDYWIDSLIANLQEVRGAAKRQIAKNRKPPQR